MTSPIIQNVVSTISLKNPNRQKLNLLEISAALDETEYRPERFSAMILHVQEPICAVALLFSTGRLVCVGTKSIEESRIAIAHCASVITTAAKIPPIVSLEEAEFTVRNMVASVALERRLNLHSMCILI